MGWIRQRAPEKDRGHECDRPRLSDRVFVHLGAVWQCDECGRQFVVVEQISDRGYSYKMWKRKWRKIPAPASDGEAGQ